MSNKNPATKEKKIPLWKEALDYLSSGKGWEWKFTAESPEEAKKIGKGLISRFWLMRRDWKDHEDKEKCFYAWQARLNKVSVRGDMVVVYEGTMAERKD